MGDFVTPRGKRVKERRRVRLDHWGFPKWNAEAVDGARGGVAAWISDWRTVRELAPDGLYLLRGDPRFLGYINSNVEEEEGHDISCPCGERKRIGRRDPRTHPHNSRMGHPKRKPKPKNRREDPHV